MIGKLYINDKDAWLTWGVALVRGAYESILLPPPNKEYTKNDMRSHAGTQVFYDNPQPAEREFNVNFLIQASTNEEYLNKYRAFTDAMNNGELRLKMPSLKTEYKVYVISCMSLSYHNKAGVLNVRFNEPNPKDRIYL